MSKKLLVILWLLLSLILPACSTLTPEERALRAEDRAYERRQADGDAIICRDGGDVWMADNRSNFGRCVSREEFERWLRQFQNRF